MSTNDPSADPLTTAELDQLAALNRARTPGPLRLDADGSGAARVRASESGNLVALCIGEADARAIAAALNALPALLAEVRAGRSASKVTLAAAIGDLVGLAYRFGLATCAEGGLTAASRRKWNKALAEARAGVERLASKGAERIEVDVEPDTAPRLHIPADLLTRPAGGGLR